MKRTPVAVLGATGMVGQRLVQGLQGHPWFELVAVAASERSADRPYGEACRWRLGGDHPEASADLRVLRCEPGQMPEGVHLVLSALDNEVAGEVETGFAEAGFAVVSNAGAHRMDPRVPLVIPEVNPGHLSLVSEQSTEGFVVTNPNCSAMPVAMVLAPLHAVFGVQSVVAATWQAVSGAGYPGESAWDMVGNVHPHPGAEEEKMAREPQKILGSAGSPAEFLLSARCVRVPVADGHLVSVQVKLGGDPSPDQIQQVLADYQSPVSGLPSSPDPLFHFPVGRDRPAPRFDADRGDGMAVSVGRIERCEVLGAKLFCLAHNTRRGAAGAALANAELLLSRGLIPGH